MKIPEKSALLLVDIQDSHQHMSVYDGEEQQSRLRYYHENVRRTVNFFRQNKEIPIVHIIELHRDDLSDFGRELDGSEHVHCLEKDSFFWEGAAPIEGEYIVQKRRYSAFFATDLELLLRGREIEHLFICGGMTDICVHFTAVDAHQRNYHIHVLREACHTHSPLDVAEAAFENMEYFQTGAVMSVEDLEW
jgi:nicotinamidase-related amidase